MSMHCYVASRSLKCLLLPGIMAAQQAGWLADKILEIFKILKLVIDLLFDIITAVPMHLSQFLAKAYCKVGF